MSILKKKTAKPARKKIVKAPEVEKAPAKPVESFVVKSIASVRVMQAGSAIVSVDGVYKTVPNCKVTITIEG